MSGTHKSLFDTALAGRDILLWNTRYLSQGDVDLGEDTTYPTTLSPPFHGYCKA